jgi:hypothetical protein
MKKNIRKKRTVIREDFSHITAPKGAAIIPLTMGQFAIVDADIFEILDTYNWAAQYSKSSDTFYAYRFVGNESRRYISMHREIMGVSDAELVIDHINHNGLDNRKVNLRVCTNTENLMNRRPNKNTTSKYVGVSFCKKGQKWLARIKVDSKAINLGYYKTEIEAALARDAAARKYFGEFANINIKTV